MHQSNNIYNAVLFSMYALDNLTIVVADLKISHLMFEFLKFNVT